MVNDSVSQSDTESGVRLALTLTVQKLSYRRIGQSVTLRGLSNGGEPHGLFPCSLAYCGRVMAQFFLVIVSHVHVVKIGVRDNPPYYLLSLRGCPVTFLERLAASASLGFEPRTFGSEVPSFAHPATEAAMF